MLARAPDIYPDLDWAASGAMALTGHTAGPPLLVPWAVTSAAREAIDGLTAVASQVSTLDAHRLHALDAPALLGERAAVFAHARRGATSVGGTCHLLRCADGWIAVNLARPEDVELLPAWLGEGDTRDAHAFVSTRARNRAADEIVERARLLGLPAARMVSSGANTGLPSWLRVGPREHVDAPVPAAPPLVVDLSSLWAGPLCTHLLSLAGARVIKIESSRRPDGARRGPGAFFDLMNAGKRCVALDFTANEGVRLLRTLIDRADIVVESSRPRALRQLGIVAEEVVAARPGRVWLSITGYGRAEPTGNWVAFGDDAAVAGGLVIAPATDGDVPLFCGDAIADPLTGMYAALAAVTRWKCRAGGIVDIALRDVSVFTAGRSIHGPRGRVSEFLNARGQREWEVTVADTRHVVAAPRARPVDAHAPALGADTREVLQELGISC